MPRIDNSWYDDLGDGWWDERGPVAGLHEINAVRSRYMLAALPPPPADRPLRVLDLGCGGGLMAERYADAGATTIGIDPSLPSLAAARRHAARSASTAGGIPHYLGARGETLPFADASFDAVCTADVLEHVDDLALVLDECTRVLRPGGRFIFDTINRTWLSRVVMIWAVQDLLRFAPPHTHDFAAFVQPAELRAALERWGLRWGDLRGLSFRRHPLVAAALYLTRRKAGGFRLSDDTRISYIGYATKAG